MSIEGTLQMPLEELRRLKKKELKKGKPLKTFIILKQGLMSLILRN